MTIIPARPTRQSRRPGDDATAAIVLPLQRALRALDDAKRALKQLSGTKSVEADPALADSVSLLRAKVKKARNRARTIAQRWFEISTYDRS